MIGDFNLSTKIEFHSTISRHGIDQAILALLIWLNEIVLHKSFIHAAMLFRPLMFQGDLNSGFSTAFGEPLMIL